jgi:hypothetical protein
LTAGFAEKEIKQDTTMVAGEEKCFAPGQTEEFKNENWLNRTRTRRTSTAIARTAAARF